MLAGTREANRLERHQLEAEITWRYLKLYLPPRGRLLEVGFGTGFYTFLLARRGYQITAVDLADEYVTRCEVRAEELDLSDRVDFRTGDARTLDGIPRGKFEAVLLMGPLYHLLLETDRRAALRSAYACLKPGGVILSALISRFGILGNLIKENSSWIENQEEVWSLARHGHRPADAPTGGFRGYYVRLDEIAGVEPAISADDESYNTLEGKQRDLWLELLFEVSAEQSMVASSRHILYVGQRPED